MPETAAGETVGPDVDLIEHYYERGFSDGLPVAPPTPEKVAAMLEALGGGRTRSSAGCRPGGGA